MSVGWSGYGFNATSFNIKDGFVDAILRGYKGGLLTSIDYNNLSQCESLEDIKLHLQSTDYGPHIQNEPSPLQTSVIVNRCTEKLVQEFNHLREQVS